MMIKSISYENKYEKNSPHDTHVNLGAKMVPFAGFEMPVQYQV